MAVTATPWWEQVRQRREELGMTQEQLGIKIGKGSGYVSRLEAGHFRNPALPTLQALANTLGWELDDLLERMGLRGRLPVLSSNRTAPEIVRLIPQLEKLTPDELGIVSALVGVLLGRRTRNA